jgi:hypothetical protein
MHTLQTRSQHLREINSFNRAALGLAYIEAHSAQLCIATLAYHGQTWSPKRQGLRAAVQWMQRGAVGQAVTRKILVEFADLWWMQDIVVVIGDGCVVMSAGWWWVVVMGGRWWVASGSLVIGDRL